MEDKYHSRGKLQTNAAFVDACSRVPIWNRVSMNTHAPRTKPYPCTAAVGCSMNNMAALRLLSNFPCPKSLPFSGQCSPPKKRSHSSIHQLLVIIIQYLYQYQVEMNFHFHDNMWYPKISMASAWRLCKSRSCCSALALITPCNITRPVASMPKKTSPVCILS